MPGTALFMGPMARKKDVGSKYNPNSYRVISNDAENLFHDKISSVGGHRINSGINLLGQPRQPITWSEHRHNKPNPGHVNFLRQDVRLLNEPVCDVHTASTKGEQHIWWNHSPSKETPSKPEHTLDTTIRADFQYRGTSVHGNSRHSSNPNTAPALGSVPVNMLRKPDGKQRLWKEGISYEHQFNSRLDPSYPVRAKRHGAFVWDEFPPKQTNDLLHQHGLISDKTDQTDPKITAVATPPKPASPVVQQQEVTSPAVKPELHSSPVLPPIGAL